MKINEIVNEEYVDTIAATHGFGGDDKYVEVFVNPERKEIQDIPALYGYRLLIDLYNKKFYACDGNALHVDMWNGLDLDVQYVDVQGGEQSQYFTFAAGQYTGSQFVQLESDTFTNEILYYAERKSPEHNQNVMDNITHMLEQDWNWISTWCDPQKAKQIVINLKQQVEDNLQHANQ